ncbi:MAG: hypothetical protein HY513_02520 [Candidatus Aenigmarchaeota archaeon]|nr:hypothetical protein [Candidatus Aenigmarchaeota archaeon]
MEKIGWTIVMILEIIGLITSLVSINIIGVIIVALVIWYLRKNRTLFK